MTPKFIQRNCTEGNKIDLRQANAILKYKPDVILFELSAGKTGPDTIFNKYPANKKPLKKVGEIIKKLEKSSKKYPYAKSDIVVWQNIQKLWSQGHDIKIYNIDAPDELRRKYSENFEPKYPKSCKDWLFWVYLYLREKSMTNNIEKILKNYKKKKNPIVAVFLQSIHWKHVQFLFKKPNKKEIWKYYFGKFPKLKQETMTQEIKKQNQFLWKWWVRLN